MACFVPYCHLNEYHYYILVCACAKNDIMGLRVNSLSLQYNM